MIKHLLTGLIISALTACTTVQSGPNTAQADRNARARIETGTGPSDSGEAGKAMSGLRDLAESLLEHWSRKDAAAVTALLSEDVVVTAPHAPGGRMTGPEEVERFLTAQNTDRSRLPVEDLDYHETMARSKLRLKRAVEQGNSIAIEVELSTGTDGETQDLAAFIDVDSQRRITSITLYFHAPPQL